MSLISNKQTHLVTSFIVAKCVYMSFDQHLDVFVNIIAYIP